MTLVLDHAAGAIATNEDGPVSAVTQQGLRPSDVHILLVDDERLSRVVVGNLLKRCGYTVTVAESGAEALQVLQKAGPGAFQLILTDVMMPEVDGLELLRFVRSSPLFANLPVVMMSASEQQETVYECIRGGAEEYLVKPVTRKEVQNIWTHVIKRLNAGMAHLTTRMELEAADEPEASVTGSVAGLPPAATTIVNQGVDLLEPLTDGITNGIHSAGGTEARTPFPSGLNEAAYPTLFGSVGVAASGSRQAPIPQQLSHMTSDPGAVAARIATGHSASTSQPQQHRNVGMGSQPAGGHHQRSGGGRSVKAGRVNLQKWLARPQRVVQPKESFWIFCEVLLLLERTEQSHVVLPIQRLRPSRMLLHSTGKVTYLPLAEGAPGRAGAMPVSPPGHLPAANADHKPQVEAAGGTSRGDSHANSSALMPAAQGSAQRSSHKAINGTDYSLSNLSGPASAVAAEEELLFQSPEEAAGQVATVQSDIFALGLLFFQLFFVPPEGSWHKVLSAVRQRVLPPSFLRHQPKEASITLALLHPNPACRPTLWELLRSDMFRDACGGLRQRHFSLEAQEAALEAAALMDFLRMMQQRRLEDVRRVKRDLDMLGCDIRLVEDHIEARGKAKKLRSGIGGIGSIGSVAAGRLLAGGNGSTGVYAVGNDSSTVAAEVQGQMPCRLSNADGSGGSGSSGSFSDLTNGNVDAGKRPASVVEVRPPACGDQLQQFVPVDGISGVAKATGYRREAVAARQRWQRVQGMHAQLQRVFFKRRDVANSQQVVPSLVNDADAAGVPLVKAAAAGTTATALTSQSVALTGGAAANVAASLPQALQARQQQRRHLAPVRRRSSISAGGFLLGPVLPEYLSQFSEDLSSFTKWQKLQVVASLRYGDALSTANMVCSASFDRDDEFFATAGVSKRIKVFESSGVMGAAHLGMHYPVLEINSRSRLSSVCWSSYIKSHLASSDYEGVVQLWDANSAVELLQFEEHAKRVWSIDFSRVDPTRLVSGSDDGTVKVWSINQEHSVMTIDSKANVCSVQFSPDASHLVAFGSANYRVYLYDLRHAATPLAVVPGHNKAVSYVRHLSGSQLVSASTDNTLKMWDIRRLIGLEGSPSLGGSFGLVSAVAGGTPAVEPEMTFTGHCNERNFVGLSVTPAGYLACGSEDNTVCCYYKSMPMPMVSCSFAGDGTATSGLMRSTSFCDQDSEQGGGGGSGSMAAAAGAVEGPPGQFVSSVCWSQKGDKLLAANSVGAIKILAPV